MKIVFLVILLLTSMQCFSQDTDEPVVVQLNLPPGDALTSNNTRYFTVKGSPYLNEEHQMGTVINGVTKIEAPIRYNAYSDTFQFLDENKKKTSILKSPKITIDLDGKIYQLMTYEESVQDKSLYYLPQIKSSKKNGNQKQGYFCALSDGETVLYSKTVKRIPKLQLPENGYTPFTPTAFLTLNHYYIKRKYRPATRIKLSKKEVLFALNDHYNEVRAYIKKNTLKVKTVEEVIQVISYYDTLD